MKSAVSSRVSRGQGGCVCLHQITEDSGNRQSGRPTCELIREYRGRRCGRLRDTFGLTDDISAMGRRAIRRTSLSSGKDRGGSRRPLQQQVLEVVATGAGTDVLTPCGRAEGAKLCQDDRPAGRAPSRAAGGRMWRSAPRRRWRNTGQAGSAPACRSCCGDTEVDEQRILRRGGPLCRQGGGRQRRSSACAATWPSSGHDAEPRTSAVGRKLDFLVQEMNREANTIGSKAAGL